MKVRLQNNAKAAQSEREGTYLQASKVNGQPSWTSKSCGCGIWYVLENQIWMIGPLQFIGEANGGIESKVLGSEVEYPENIMEWNYHTSENGWVYYDGSDDIIIECIDQKDHKKKGKYPKRTIITCSLYIFYPIFQLWFIIKSDFKSRVGYDRACTVYMTILGIIFHPIFNAICLFCCFFILTLKDLGFLVS